MNRTDEPWGRERFYRLAKFLQCDPGDLGTVFCARPNQLQRWLMVDRIPPYFALHLNLLERAHAELVLGREPMITTPLQLLND